MMVQWSKNKRDLSINFEIHPLTSDENYLMKTVWNVYTILRLSKAAYTRFRKHNIAINRVAVTFS